HNSTKRLCLDLPEFIIPCSVGGWKEGRYYDETEVPCIQFTASAYEKCFCVWQMYSVMNIESTGCIFVGAKEVLTPTNKQTR
ncbi:MAG: hypothetical protein WCI84_10575, partial [Bacteroidota bacterium]